MIQNRYLVVHLIGKGGMGEVYLAVDQRLGSAVALKRTYYADDEMLGSAFEREAKILARLRHPVLPKVSDHFTDSGDQYLVMEHISGEDLSSRLDAAKKPFPVSWVMFWADQLLDALSYLHSHEPPIIHRDIKPQNLKLTAENHIVLLDFGLSKDSNDKTFASEAGKSGSVVGYTPHFASMEQIRGTGTDGRSDIYSLSATLYQLITNTVPADALTRAEAMLSGKPDPIVSVSEANAEISPAVSNVLLKGLEVSQDKRFSTASEMQKALRTAYSQMQNQMSAETQVFNVGDIHSTVAPIADPTAPVAPSEMATRTPTYHPDTDSNFDATVQMDASDVSIAPLQNDVKTEVFSATEIYSGDAQIVDPPMPMLTPPTPAVFEPAATVPMISLEGEAPSVPTSSEPAKPEFFTEPVVAVKKEDIPKKPVAPVRPIVAATAPPKKSGSKAGLILGGLAALFLFALAGLGGGWYYYTNYYKTSVPAATPSPSPTPVETRTPTQSPTPTENLNVNSVANGNSNSNSNSNVAATPESQTPPIGGVKTPQATPVRENQQRPPKTPGTVKPSPKPKPRDDRTVILQ